MADTKTNITDSEQCWKLNNILVHIKFLFLLLPLQVDNMKEFQKKFRHRRGESTDTIFKCQTLKTVSIKMGFLVQT
jgi:hypothetical protein